MTLPKLGQGYDEVAVFMPDEIREICQNNLAAGLRAIADALDARELDGRVLSVRGDGFTNWNDSRAHVILSVDLAAEVFTWKAGERLALPPRKPVTLPSDLRALIEKGKTE